MKILRILATLLLLGGIAFGVALATTRPEPLPGGTTSRARLDAGPYAVDLAEEVWVDDTRRTASNGDFAGAPDRTLAVAIWSPIDAPGPYPLLVYSHGFMSTRHGGTHLGEHMASFGYVVVSANFPLTYMTAPGSPNANDVANQPADVSFLIDRVLALEPNARAFSGGIDRARIGVLGTSLGGLTTTLVAFHPALSDPRISAAISIAGPSSMFGPDYFDNASVPFLMIASTHDAMIQYPSNAEPIPDLITDGGLVTIEGGSHAGFSYLTSGPIRVLGNPDSLGCSALMLNLDLQPGENPFAELGGPNEGMVDAAGTPLPCEIEFEEVMQSERQQWLATLAVRAFFESRFADGPSERQGHETFLTKTFPAELEEVRYTPARRS